MSCLRKEDPSIREKPNKNGGGSFRANHGNNSRPFCLALPRADHCDNSAERYLLTPVKEQKGPNCIFVFVARHIIPSLTFSSLVPHGPKSLPVNPTEIYPAF